MSRERYRIADLIVDVGAVTVHRNGDAVPLPPLSFDLLVTLARAAPDAVEPERLIERVWAGVAISDETVTQRVALLRRALGDDAQNPRYIRSVRRRGYRLVPAVEALGEDPRKRPRTRARSWAVAAAAATVVAALPGAIWLHRRMPEVEPAAHTAAATAAELARRAGDYLRRHQEADNELAIELYRRALEREPALPSALVGLSLALSQRATKFNRSPQEGVEALALADRALARDPTSAAAHQARALALDAQGRVGPALAGYLRAHEIDPGDLAPLASAAHLMQVQGRLAEALETNLRALSAVDRLPYLEVQTGQALAALGFEEAAAVWFERAVELRPDNVFAAATFARLRLAQGRPSDAETLVKQAREKGIRRPELSLVLGDAALLKGDTQAALGRFREAVAIDPYRSSARVRLLVLEALDSESSGEHPGLEGRYRKQVADLRGARAAGDEWPSLALDRMLLHNAFGDSEKALLALDEAIELGHRNTRWLLLDPLLADLRRRPGFASRIERMLRLVDEERRRVQGAQWATSALLAPTAGST